jgi:hypothetical protein
VEQLDADQRGTSRKRSTSSSGSRERTWMSLAAPPSSGRCLERNSSTSSGSWSIQLWWAERSASSRKGRQQSARARRLEDVRHRRPLSHLPAGRTGSRWVGSTPLWPNADVAVARDEPPAIGAAASPYCAGARPPCLEASAIPLAEEMFMLQPDVQLVPIRKVDKAVSKRIGVQGNSSRWPASVKGLGSSSLGPFFTCPYSPTSWKYGIVRSLSAGAYSQGCGPFSCLNSPA